MKKILILSVGGTFMAGLALLAKTLGYDVVGVDGPLYPPMSDVLAEADIPMLDVQAPVVLDGIDEVLIGNANSRGHPWVEAVLNARLPYFSGSQWLADRVLAGRKVIAVAGTHGKTSTTAMIAWILSYAGLKPGYLVAGLPGNGLAPAALGDGDYFVIESDEYDTAFFDKRPKCLHYKPWICVLNNLEFDHADIYEDLTAIQIQFQRLMKSIPSQGVCVHHVSPAIEPVMTPAWSRHVSFTLDAETEADWSLRHDEAGRMVMVQDGITRGCLDWPLLGEHQAHNAMAACLAAMEAGVSLGDALAALKQYQGVARRMQRIGEASGVVVIDDFAHHPTAVEATVAALASHYARVHVMMEPANYSMREGIHAQRLQQALRQAASVHLYDPGLKHAWVRNFHVPAVLTQAYAEPDALIASLAQEVRSGDVCVCMSSRSTACLPQRLVAALEANREPREVKT